jgi:DNA primase
MTASGWKGIASWVLAEAGVEERRGRVYVPYRRPDGSIHNQKVFSPSATWWAEKDRELIPFLIGSLGCTAALASVMAILVCEGESDTLSVHQAVAWHSDAIAEQYIAFGVSGAGVWRSAWVAYLRPFPTVYVLADGDDAGRAMARAVRRDSPWARIVKLPEGKDARSLLQRHGPRALDPYLDAADAAATLDAAFSIAETLEEFEALLRQEANRGR